MAAIDAEGHGQRLAQRPYQSTGLTLVNAERLDRRVILFIYPVGKMIDFTHAQSKVRSTLQSTRSESEILILQDFHTVIT